MKPTSKPEIPAETRRKLLEAARDENPVGRRSFLKVSSLIGTALPLVTTLAPAEARAQASGS